MGVVRQQRLARDGPRAGDDPVVGALAGRGQRRFPEQFSRWLGYERGWDDGETYEAMGERVLAALEELAAHHESERIVAVTHGGPIRAALARAEGISHSEARRRGPVLGNCFVARFAVRDGDFRRLD